MPVKYSFLLPVFTALAPLCSAQTAPQLQKAVQQTVQKVTPACVKLQWYDTLTHEARGVGSGVIVTAEGHILTAAHITDPGKTYKVTFANGSEAIAVALGKIVFQDDTRLPDVAMMKMVTPGTWAFAPMGQSAALHTGDPCVSIAWPESLNQPKPMVRFGRVLETATELGFIRTSAIMEPGDSGGPLFDCEGNVIGLHTAILPAEDWNMEIPVNWYRKYWQALQTGEYFREWPATVSDTTYKGGKANTTWASQQQVASQAHAIWGITGGYCHNITSTIDTATRSVYGMLLKIKGKSYIISKSSMVADKPVLQYNRKSVLLNVIKRDRENDLVLLQCNAVLPGGYPLSSAVAANDSIAVVDMGGFLVSPRTDSQLVISVTGSQAVSMPKQWSTGYFGASVAYRKGPVTVTLVRGGSPAAAMNLQKGDEVKRINGVTLDSAAAYGEQMSRYWPGDTLTVDYLRAGKEYSGKAVLTERPVFAATHPVDMFPGGKSSRRDGFKQVFMHDAILTPEQCGGPVYDIVGSFRGLNIARYGRTSVLALPADVVKQFVQDALR